MGDWFVCLEAENTWGKNSVWLQVLHYLHAESCYASSAGGGFQVISWWWKFRNGFGSAFPMGRAVLFSRLPLGAQPAGMLFSQNTSCRAGIYSTWICKSSWGWERLSSSFCEQAFAWPWCCWAQYPPPSNLSPSTGLKFHSGERIRLNSKWAVLSFYLVSFPFNDLKNANNALKSKHCLTSWKCPFPFIYLL